MKKGSKLLRTTFLVVLFLDIFTKIIVREMLPYASTIKVLPFLSLTHVNNFGMAFGLLSFGFMRWIFVSIAVIVVLGIFWSSKKKKLTEHFIAWGLIAGGALGNAIDRMFIGSVTDFISLPYWPAFNIADSALTIGVILLIYHSFKKE